MVSAKFWLSCVMVAAVSAGAQQPLLHPTAPLPQFEVATVKPWVSTAAAPAVPGNRPQKVMKVAPVGAGPAVMDHVHMIGQVSILLSSAFELPLEAKGRVLGAPDWVTSEADRYDVQAKIDDAAFTAIQKLPVDEQHRQVALMEQALLRDRFGLRAHFETRELPVYELVVKDAGRLTMATEGEESHLGTANGEHGTELTATAVSLDELVRSPLLRADGRPMVNATGLSGKYDFKLTWSAQGDADVPMLPAALQEQLGLKLVSGKQAVEVLVIEHIERPSEN